jgi:HK97 gp10 family phage protein
MFTAQVTAKVTRNRFRELSRQGRQAAATWNAKQAEETARKAREIVPTDTGALRDSIAVELNRRTGSATVTAGNEQVDYAVFVHEGTHLVEGRPFLREASKIVAKKYRNRRVTLYKG